jgi:hypothetical protein
VAKQIIQRTGLRICGEPGILEGALDEAAMFQRASNASGDLLWRWLRRSFPGMAQEMMRTRHGWRAAMPVAMAFCQTSPVLAGQAPHDLDAVGTPVRAAPADPAIVQALPRISVPHVQRTIETLVGFGTRHALSSMITDLPPGQGANAAVDWIESELKRYGEPCGGSLRKFNVGFRRWPKH